MAQDPEEALPPYFGISPDEALLELGSPVGTRDLAAIAGLCARGREDLAVEFVRRLQGIGRAGRRVEGLLDGGGFFQRAKRGFGIAFPHRREAEELVLHDRVRLLRVGIVALGFESSDERRGL